MKVTMEETLIPLNDVRKMKHSSSFSGSDVGVKEGGEIDTLDYRIQAVSDAGKKISLWHDVSLVHLNPQTRSETPYFNFVCEISKFTRSVSHFFQDPRRYEVLGFCVCPFFHSTCRNLLFVCSNRKKYEIATDEPGNPIKQDTKKGKLREVGRF